MASFQDEEKAQIEKKRAEQKALEEQIEKVRAEIATLEKEKQEKMNKISAQISELWWGEKERSLLIKIYIYIFKFILLYELVLSSTCKPYK